MNDANTLHTLTVAVDSSAMDDVLFSHNDANGTESDTSLQVCQVAAPGATLLATVTYVLLYLVLLQNAKKYSCLLLHTSFNKTSFGTNWGLTPNKLC